MGQRPRIHYTHRQKAPMWDRGRQGDPPSQAVQSSGQQASGKRRRHQAPITMVAGANGWVAQGSFC